MNPRRYIRTSSGGSIIYLFAMAMVSRSVRLVSVLLLLSAAGFVNCQMVEWDLNMLPEYNATDPTSLLQGEDDPSSSSSSSSSSSFPPQWTVQCPAGGRCYLRNYSQRPLTWGPDPDVNFRSGSWTLASSSNEEDLASSNSNSSNTDLRSTVRYNWYYFVNGLSDPFLPPGDLFPNSDPSIIGSFCLNNLPNNDNNDNDGSDADDDTATTGSDDDFLSTFVDSATGGSDDDGGGCSMICTDDCICVLESSPTVECEVLEVYPDLILPPPDERTIIEFLQPPPPPPATDGSSSSSSSSAEEDPGVSTTTTNTTEEERILQLRCPGFLEGCYLDASNFQSSATTSPTGYDGFYAIDYLQCNGYDRETDTVLPCRLGCDPECECSVYLPSTNTTESCTIAPPTEAPSDVPTASPSMDVPSPSSGPSHVSRRILMLLSTVQLLMLLPVLC